MSVNSGLKEVLHSAIGFLFVLFFYSLRMILSYALWWWSTVTTSFSFAKLKADEESLLSSPTHHRNKDVLINYKRRLIPFLGILVY